MPIDDIRWPDDPRQACSLYLGFAIGIVEELSLPFESGLPDPIATAKAFVAGQLSDDDYRACANPWWSHLESLGAIREFRKPEALRARLAICLLSATTTEAYRLGDHLSWFLEVLGFGGVELDPVIEQVERQFPR